MNARSVHARQSATIPETTQAAPDNLPTHNTAHSPARHAFAIVMIALGIVGSAAWVILLLWMIIAVAIDSWS